MPFYFIDNNAPVSEGARRRIRSHAAIGKNLGKKFVRGRKNRERKLTEQGAGNSAAKLANNSIRLQRGKVNYHGLPSHCDESLRIERQVGDGLILQGLPVAVAAGDTLLTRRGTIIHHSVQATLSLALSFMFAYNLTGSQSCPLLSPSPTRQT